jgi:hypothetical protein
MPLPKLLDVFVAALPIVLVLEELYEAWTSRPIEDIGD